MGKTSLKTWLSKVEDIVIVSEQYFPQKIQFLIYRVLYTCLSVSLLQGNC